MNVLITGSEGFVGRQMQHMFKDESFNLCFIDRVRSSSNKNYFNFDLGRDNIDTLCEKLKPRNINLVIHLAAAKGDFNLKYEDFYNDNVKASKDLVKLISKLKINNVIHYSTVSVYGHNNTLTDEKAGLYPNNDYGKTKLESEKIFINWKNNEENRNLTILRPSVIYGENNFANMYNLLNLLYRKFPITIGNGEYIKSMIAVENIVEITLFTLKRVKGLQIYNCTDEPYPTIKQVVSEISKISGFNKPVIKIPVRLAMALALPFELLSFLTGKDFGINRDRVYKYSMATDYRSGLLKKKGYIQKYDTFKMLKKMAIWFKKQKI